MSGNIGEFLFALRVVTLGHVILLSDTWARLYGSAICCCKMLQKCIFCCSKQLNRTFLLMHCRVSWRGSDYALHLCPVLCTGPAFVHFVYCVSSEILIYALIVYWSTAEKFVY